MADIGERHQVTRSTMNFLYPAIGHEMDIKEGTTVINSSNNVMMIMMMVIMIMI